MSSSNKDAESEDSMDVTLYTMEESMKFTYFWSLMWIYYVCFVRSNFVEMIL